MEIILILFSEKIDAEQIIGKAVVMFLVMGFLNAISCLAKGLIGGMSNMKKAHVFADKQTNLAVLFEMGKYHEIACKLELATVEQDVDVTLDIMEKMLAGLSDINHFSKVALYEHMKFQEPREEFMQELRDNLLTCFSDEETYGFLKEDKRYQELLKG